MSTFLKMRANRENGNKKLLEQLDNAQSTGYKKDERFYYPVRDAAGNASVVIRFLPGPILEGANDSIDFVKEYKHSFKGPSTKWFIEPCPTQLGGDNNPCPCCEENSRLWALGEPGEKVVREGKRSRQVSFVSNVLIVRDSKNPELEGKVMLFRYGKKIFDMVASAAKPKFAEDPSINVFDLWEGADFNFRIVKKDKQTNYDDSKFKDPSAIGKDDDEREKLYNQVVDLSEFNSPKLFKTYPELQKRLAIALGVPQVGEAAPAAADAPVAGYTATPATAGPSAPAASAPAAVTTEDEPGDDENPLAFFQRQAAKASNA